MATYKIDPLHSDIAFKVKHMMISTVNGCFQKFDATMESNTEDFSDAKITFECDVDSVYTNIADRDAHLKSPDFFSAAEYPKITYTSTLVEKNGEDYIVTGDLTIRGITKPIVLDGSYNGNDVDMYGNTKHGFELSGRVNRADYGLTFNALSGKGNAMVGDEIKLLISIQMLEQK
jgi:polyisoprenoid-binding protein YceI